MFSRTDISIANLHVPENSLYSYKETEPWYGFGNIVALTDSEASIEMPYMNIAVNQRTYNLMGQRLISTTSGLVIAL